MRKRNLSSALNAISGALFFLTAVRMLVVCLSHPIIAYANSYDFVRQSSCVGVWEDYGGKDKTQGNPERPVNTLVFDGDKRTDVCLPSVDNIFPWLISRWAGRGSHITLTMVGSAKAILAIAMMIALASQPIGATARLGWASAAFAVLGDIAIDSYLNTLYLEWSVVISTFGGCAAITCLYARRSAPGLWLLLVLTSSILWLEFAKEQYSYFGLILTALSVIGLFSRWNMKLQSATLAFIIVTSQIVIFEMRQHKNEHAMQAERANKADTFLGAVLPAAKDKISALRTLNLPISCLPEIGKTWYSEGFQKNNSCKEIYKVPRIRLLYTFMGDRNTIIQPIIRGVEESRPIYLSYLGHFEKPSVEKLLYAKILINTSLSKILDMLSPKSYIALILICMPALVYISLCYAWKAFSRRLEEMHNYQMMIGLGSSLLFYALFTSVFGDGYFEVPRHAIGMLVGIGIVLGGLLDRGLTLWSSRFR